MALWRGQARDMIVSVFAASPETWQLFPLGGHRDGTECVFDVYFEYNAIENVEDFTDLRVPKPAAPAGIRSFTGCPGGV